MTLNYQLRESNPNLWYFINDKLKGKHHQHYLWQVKTHCYGGYATKPKTLCPPGLKGSLR
jgi:hypothetical protein